jgi:hypothetical protein
MRTLIAVVACLALAACGGEERPQSSGVTIENKLGDVTISERPVGVVALDFPSADDAIALGVVPVGMAKVAYAPGGVQEWTRAALAGHQPELLDVDTGMPLEEIAALRIGRALGREDCARDPAFEGRTLSFFNFFEGSPYVINTESDFSIRFLSELGFVPPATSMAFPSLLGIPYALDELVPRLAEAVG